MRNSKVVIVAGMSLEADHEMRMQGPYRALEAKEFGIYIKSSRSFLKGYNHICIFKRSLGAATQ